MTQTLDPKRNLLAKFYLCASKIQQVEQSPHIESPKLSHEEGEISLMTYVFLKMLCCLNWKDTLRRLFPIILNMYLKLILIT